MRFLLDVYFVSQILKWTFLSLKQEILNKNKQTIQESLSYFSFVITWYPMSMLDRHKSLYNLNKPCNLEIMKNYDLNYTILFISPNIYI